MNCDKEKQDQNENYNSVQYFFFLSTSFTAAFTSLEYMIFLDKERTRACYRTITMLGYDILMHQYIGMYILHFLEKKKTPAN